MMHTQLQLCVLKCSFVLLTLASRHSKEPVEVAHLWNVAIETNLYVDFDAVILFVFVSLFLQLTLR